MSTPNARGYYQHPSDPFGVERWFDGTNWTDRVTGVPRPLPDGMQPPPLEIVDVTSASFLAGSYARACTAVVEDANACLQAAREAVSAHEAATDPNQHRTSAERFANLANQQHAQFVLLYKRFLVGCARARSEAAVFLGSSTPTDHEHVLAKNVTTDQYRNCRAARHLLSATLRTTPHRFVADMTEVVENIDGDIFELGEAGFSGRVFVPREPEDKQCPWCAETIRKQAAICRYCRSEQLDPVGRRVLASQQRPSGEH